MFGHESNLLIAGEMLKLPEVIRNDHPNGSANSTRIDLYQEKVSKLIGQT
jgi:hypothetical protein